MAARTVLYVKDVYDSDSSDSESSVPNSAEEEINASGDISGNLELGEDLLSEDDSVVVGRKDTTKSVENSTPTSVSVSHSVSRRLIPSRCTELENEVSVTPMKDLTNHSDSVPDGSANFSATKGTDTQELILQEIRKANSRLDEFAENIKSIETRLDSVENHCINVTPVSTATSSCAEDSGEKIRRKVPKKVSREVREVYKSLLDHNGFSGFDTQKRFADSANQAVVKVLINEMERLNSKIPFVQIRDAARRFFQTKVEDKYLKNSGKYDHKIVLQRRRNRLNRKLECRKAVFLKASSSSSCSLSTEQINLWKKVLTKEFMSSEESAEEDFDGNKHPVIAIKPLPWRTAKVDRFFRRLDQRNDKGKTKHSKQQTLPRVIGSQSSRPKPSSLADDFFGFV